MKNITKSILMLMITSIIFFASCSKEDVGENFVITIDNLYAPETVTALKDTVNVHLQGYIGPTDCQVFDRAVFQFSGEKIIVVAVGKDKQKKGNCKPQESRLDNVVRIIIPYPGVYTFYALNENDSITATRQITVN